jgi:hypothetical protein
MAGANSTTLILSAGISALISGFVALGIEWLAKPRLEARKNCIVARKDADAEIRRQLAHILEMPSSSYSMLAGYLGLLAVHLSSAGTHNQIGYVVAAGTLAVKKAYVSRNWLPGGARWRRPERHSARVPERRILSWRPGLHG